MWIGLFPGFSCYVQHCNKLLAHIQALFLPPIESGLSIPSGMAPHSPFISILCIFSPFFLSVAPEYLPESGTGHREMTEKPILSVQSSHPIEGGRQLTGLKGGRELGHPKGSSEWSKRAQRWGMSQPQFSLELKSGHKSSWVVIVADLHSHVCTMGIFFFKPSWLELSCWKAKSKSKRSQRMC